MPEAPVQPDQATVLSRAGKLRRRALILGFGATIGAAIWGRKLYLTPPGHSNSRLSVTDAHRAALAGEITLIDIRTPNEWRATGIPEGGRPIDMRREDFIEALEDVVGTDRDVPVALICARGVRSARMTLRLSTAGFTNIIDVPEGMLGSEAGPGWIREKLPISDWAG